MQEYLDSVVRWGLRDLVSEKDPSPRVWQAIRGRLSDIGLPAGRLGAFSLLEKLSLHMEQAVWQPFPSAAARSWSLAEEVWIPLWPHWRTLPRLAL